MSNQIITFKVPSVFDGDVPFLTFFATDKHGAQKECGKLWGKGGVLTFEGNAEQSAKVFFEHVIQANRDFLMQSNNGGSDD